VRILAIRGGNLASLARTFAVELASGPLADAGLFAITGPVGAGKSTLLDALCLALFGRTPRLSGHGGAPVGDVGQDRGDWLSANDPRTLLRRDAIEGHAEVDFVGRDGVVYRARWSVRRARRKRDGRLQAPEQSLLDVRRDVVLASDRRTEVQALIRQKLGLDFAQFCRSVLLAQGEFHAFLHARADERAKLLETLTGASVYRQLSKAAHEKRREWQHRADTMRAQFDASSVLSIDERAALEHQAADLAQQIAICDIGIRKAREYVLWHQQADALQRAESDATVALREAVEANAAAEPRRAALRARQQAIAVVPRWEFATEARRRVRDAEKATEHAATSERQAADALARHDAQLAAELRAAFGEITAAPALVRELPKWAATLQRWQQARQKLRAVEQRAPELQRAREQAQADLQRAERQREELDAVRAEADKLLERAEADVAAADFDTLTTRRRQLTADGRQLDQLDELLQRWRRALAARLELREAMVAAQAKRDELREQRARDERRVQDVARQLQDARERLRRTEQQHGLDALRAQLVDGEACPLCGSEQHPAAAHEAADVQVVQRAAAATERAHDEVRERFAKLCANVERADADVAEREHRHASAEREVAEASAAVSAALEAELAMPDAEQQLQRRRREHDEQERELTAVEKQAEARAAAQRSAREAVARGARAQRALDEQLREADKAVRAADDAVQRAAHERETLAAAVTELREVLEPLCGGLPGGAAAIEAAGDGAIERLRELHAMHERREAAERAFTEAREHHARAAQRRGELREERDVAAEQLERSLQVHGVAEDDVAVAQRLGPDALADEAQQLQALADEVIGRRATLRERTHKRREHEGASKPMLDADDAGRALDDAERAKQRLADQQLEKRSQIHSDDRALRHRRELQPRLERTEKELATWSALSDLIGHSTGDAFAVYAQGLTLELLLLEANRRLEELARRYRLDRNDVATSGAAELDFVVVDLDLGGARRSLHTLSGGETFLVSLALALALATLAAPRSRVETLFLDEGFGTLDAHNLEIALGALDSLQATGCQVGVISHVDGFAERIGTVVEVRPEGSGQSRVIVQ